MKQQIILICTDLQKYYLVDFKLRFTEIHDGLRTKYSLDTYQFNVPGLTAKL